LTTPLEAYNQGRQARRDNLTATNWDGFLPYAVNHLSSAWLDGWYDEACEYAMRWRREEAKHSVLGGYCPYCWFNRMTDLPDGTLRCLYSSCRERNYPPVDRDKAKVFLAQRDAGSYI
jgi:hypothetical protein